MGSGDVAHWGDFDVHFGQLLGRGGMGSVYRALQRSLGRWVAVKVLDLSNAADPALREGFLQKFRMEVAALARLNDPRIVTILQSGEDEGRLWFAMELIEGRTVEERLSREGALTEAEARRVAAEVARALDAASRQGITHRDVKPANIFLLPDGSVKLGDFGLARVAELGPTRMTEANAVACTPAYASPEQAEGGACDLRSDLYSLGCVLYEMVTERPPFSGASHLGTLVKHALKAPTLPRLLNPRLSECLESIILRCLEKEPEARYQDYPELIEALEPTRPAPARPHGWLWPAAAAAGLALLGVILTAVFMEASVPPPQASAPPPKIAVQPLEVPVRVRMIAPQPPPAPAPVRAPAYEGPLPIVREGRPADVRPSPTLEEADSRAWFLAHLPTPDELQLIRRGWAAAERHDGVDAIAEVRSIRVDPRRTPYTSLILDAELSRMNAALEIRAAFADRLVPGMRVALRLVDGRTVAGIVEKADAESLELRAAGRVRLGRKEIAEQSIYAHEPPERQLLYRATYGDPHGAATVLARRLETDLSVEDLARLPGLLHAMALRAAVALEAPDRAPAKALLKDFDALEPRIPKNLHYALEARAMLDYELRAAEALARKAHEEVLRDYDRSRSFPRAAAEVLASFRGRAGVECVAEGHREAWKFEPFEKDVDARRRHLYEDPASRAFVLDQSEGLRVMRRRIPQAARGYALEYAFVPAVGSRQGASQWVLVLSEASKPLHLQLVGTSAGLALYETHPDGRSGKEVARHEFQEAQLWKTLSIVPVGKLVVVYEGARLAFKVTPPGEGGLEANLEIGLTGGALKLRSLKAASGSDE